MREEQTSNKASISNLNTLLLKEEETIRKKIKEINDQENNLEKHKII